MLRELINFTASLDESFKSLGSQPKEGLHILINIKSGKKKPTLDLDNLQHEQYSKKQKAPPSTFLNKCKLLHQNAWFLDPNKCLDLPAKSIHTCSPFVVAFKKEHLQGGAKYIENQRRKKPQIYERFGNYFDKALALLGDKAKTEKYKLFEQFFTKNAFSRVLTKIEREYKKRGNPLEDSSYILFYLNLPLKTYQKAYRKYLDDNLFNTASYNTAPDPEGRIFGTCDFMNRYNARMPFLMHQTATFDISGRISSDDARLLNDLKNIFPNKTLPNPLPIFVYREELQRKVISIFKESGFKFKYREIMQKLWEDNVEDVADYYLLFWNNTKDGVEFSDFDFVSRFEYWLPEPITIKNHFEFRNYGEKKNQITNIFELEDQILKPLIQNKYRTLHYFGDPDKNSYDELELTFFTYCKYRKAVYDLVYKSRKNTLNGHIFREMIFNSILDDLKNDKGYQIRHKLNIWYTFHDFFNPKQNTNMADKLKDYQHFVQALIAEEPLTDISDEKFAFAAGQVIKYILKKSKSDDNSYNLLDPYLQQSKCNEFKKAIAHEFGRYSHEIFSRNFEKVAAFVLSYETNSNIRNYLPQILSGAFSKNQLYNTQTK